MNIARIAFLPSLRLFDDLALLAIRLVTGALLIHGVWDNIVDAGRMLEFEAFLRVHGFAWPSVMAPLSVWVQFLVGAGLILGLLTRWSGLLCVANFIVALVMVHLDQDFRNWWPALALILLGLIFATRGAGRYALDWLLQSRGAGSRPG
ncbi:MAG: DoxX family protein [Pseudomonadota bacterium]|jgi:uncharacterized membrane protein YphA (DoxX/SURF4 family)|nr:DoxX family protein [Pseudomonadota bacterium]